MHCVQETEAFSSTNKTQFVAVSSVNQGSHLGSEEVEGLNYLLKAFNSCQIRSLTTLQAVFIFEGI